MRQVFSSARLENVEGVATLLRDAGIEVRITQGRSYKGNRRSSFSYREDHAAKPAVWVVRSEDQVRARELLRDAGLIATTRKSESFGAPTFHTPPSDAAVAADGRRRRAFRIRMALLAGIVLVGGMGIVRQWQAPPAPVLATPPFDGTPAATLPAVAAAVFAHEMQEARLPALCFGIDGRDAPTAVINAVGRQPFVSVPASHCQRDPDSERGSVLPKSGLPALIIETHDFRPSAPDTATVQVSAYHHRTYGSYKTLEVRHVDGAWRVTRTLRHVSMQG